MILLPAFLSRRASAVAKAFAVLTLLAVSAGGASAQGAFYQPTAQELAGPPGSLIRTEPMSGAPLGAQTSRILYRSTGLKGEPIAVSGAVIIPQGTPPAGGWPIVAWAHPTSGIIPRCAPSLALMMFQQIQGLRDMVQRGYVVVATDYPGLGTAGPHPYLVGESEGRAVLDSLRAARAVVGTSAGNRVAIWGHSQGGQAALYAGELTKAYAPDLDLVGVATAAPATELGDLMRADLATNGGKNLLAMTLWSWDQVYGAPMANIVQPSAIPVINKLADICLESIVDILPRQEAGKELAKDFLTVSDPTAVEPWKSLMDQNTIGTLPPALPLFIAQGTADDTVVPSVTASYMQKLCAAGSRVAFLSMPGVGHAFAASKAATDAVSWIADRFAGAPTPTSCPQ